MKRTLILASVPAIILGIALVALGIARGAGVALVVIGLIGVFFTVGGNAGAGGS
jgi:hypothetical protein